MLSIMPDHFKDVLSTQSNYFLPLKDNFRYFLFGGGSFEIIPSAQFWFDFQNFGIKIFVWTLANNNKYQKNYLGGL